MRKTAAVILIFLVIFMTGCGKAEEPEVSIDLGALQEELDGADLFFGTPNLITKEGVVSSVLYLTAGDIESYVLYMSAEFTGEEYGLFECVSAEAAVSAAEKLTARVDAQIAVLESYAPEAIPRLKNAVIKQQGVYAGYIVADDSAGALEIMEKYFK